MCVMCGDGANDCEVRSDCWAGTVYCRESVGVCVCVSCVAMEPMTVR